MIKKNEVRRLALDLFPFSGRLLRLCGAQAGHYVVVTAGSSVRRKSATTNLNAALAVARSVD
jgi:hypothetical protein